MSHDPSHGEDRCESCWERTAETPVTVPERHRKAGQGRVLYLCGDCASGQRQCWYEEDMAARETERLAA